MKKISKRKAYKIADKMLSDSGCSILVSVGPREDLHLEPMRTQHDIEKIRDFLNSQSKF